MDDSMDQKADFVAQSEVCVGHYKIASAFA